MTHVTTESSKIIESGRASEICCAAAMCCALVLIPDAAFAWTYNGGGQRSPVGASLCYVAAAFDGELAAALGTTAVCILGTLAAIGRIQWTTALVVAVGLSVIFGVTPIVVAFGGASCS